MRTAEHQGVDIVGQQGLEVFARGEAGNFVIEPALFHQRHQQRAGLRLHTHIGVAAVDGAGISIAVYRGAGGHHADMVGARGGKRRFGAGGDHVEHRHIARHRAHFLAGHGGNGVAGNHQRLHIVLQQKFNDLGGKGFNGGARFHPVRHTGGVAEIHDIFHRQPLHQRAHIGETAHPRIEHADRALFVVAHIVDFIQNH